MKRRSRLLTQVLLVKSISVAAVLIALWGARHAQCDVSKSVSRSESRVGFADIVLWDKTALPGILLRGFVIKLAHRLKEDSADSPDHLPHTTRRSMIPSTP
ncbi:jg23454 [Pararge aegeria aegeria]|uniref:Jg23454 protein n=1 Tax=Pararge aegeria aegeria TaxID=348720 RepID=A0A8S4RYX0_9NEOP|nr:jg23454 [Pararge aegeria aegeria]